MEVIIVVDFEFSLLEVLEKSHTRLKDASQWYNSESSPKTQSMFKKTQFCSLYSLTGIKKIIPKRKTL